MATYMYPFPRLTRVSQTYGAEPGAKVNGITVNPPGGHTGEDAAVPVGTPIHAAGDGVIAAAGYFPTYANEWLYGPMGGLTLVLDCGDDEPTFGYAHCSKSFVKAGDRVVKGQIIGESGNSGSASTGAHCHIEALPPRWNTYNGTYGRVNPRSYMTEFPDGINVQGSTNASEDDELLSVEAQKWMQDTFMTKKDGAYQNERMFTKADGAYMNSTRDDQFAALMSALDGKLDKLDGNYIVNLLKAVKPGQTDAKAVADAIAGIIPEAIAKEVADELATRLGGK